MADEDTGTEEVFVVDLDEDWINSLYDRLANMQCDLDADPLRYGPKRLSAKLSETRKYLSDTEGIYLEISKKLRLLTKEKRRSSSEFDMRRNDLLAHDPDVRAGRSVSDRDALVNVKLSSIVQHLAEVELAIQDLEHVEKVVKSKRADLRDTQNRIRDQIKLCQEEIGLGSSWGSALPPGAKPALGRGSVIPSADDLDDLLDGDGAHLEEAEGPAEAETESDPDLEIDLKVESVALAVPDDVRDFDQEAPKSGSMSEVDTFLDESTELEAPKKPASPEIDLDGLLDELAEM